MVSSPLTPFLIMPLAARYLSPWRAGPGDDTLRHMTRWLVTLAGDAADLDQLVEWPAAADWKIVRHEKHGVAMCGERFEVLDDHGSVRRGGEALLAHLNRAARHRLTKFQGVSLGAIVEQEKGGDDTTQCTFMRRRVLQYGRTCTQRALP